jgi:hypothetical protein
MSSIRMTIFYKAKSAELQSHLRIFQLNRVLAYMIQQNQLCQVLRERQRGPHTYSTQTIQSFARCE